MSCVRHFWLGDVQTLSATDAINEAVGLGAFGSYEVIPTKARGLLPEYGLATAFDGAVQRVNTLSGLTGTGGTFTLTALIRPTVVDLSAGQCVYQTGGPGAAYLGIDAAGFAVFGVNGGTVVSSAAALVAGSAYLLVGSYDGTDGTLFVGELVEGAVVAEAGPTALTFTAAHDLGTIGSNENTSYFDGAIQGVAELNEALVLADVQALHATGIWTDVTADVEGPLTIDHGIHANGPADRGRAPLRSTTRR
jgi:hypothetical protein